MFAGQLPFLFEDCNISDYHWSLDLEEVKNLKIKDHKKFSSHQQKINPLVASDK